MKAYCTRYRPVDAGDSRGGKTQTLANGLTLAVETKMHDGELTILVDADESVELGDILEFTGNIW